MQPGMAPLPEALPVPLSRAARAHTRLSWETRLARNARRETADHVTIKLFGIPNDFACDLGLAADEGPHNLITVRRGG